MDQKTESAIVALEILFFLAVVPLLSWFLGIWVKLPLLQGFMVAVAILILVWVLKTWRDFWDIDGVTTLRFIPIWSFLSSLLFLFSLWKHNIS